MHIIDGMERFVDLENASTFIFIRFRNIFCHFIFAIEMYLISLVKFEFHSNSISVPSSGAMEMYVVVLFLSKYFHLVDSLARKANCK